MKTNWPALKYGCLILAGMTLAAIPAPAQTVESGGARKSAVISSVAITQAPERSAVRVEGEGKLDVRAARMQHPDRLVLDFVGARLAVHKTVIPGVSAPVLDVRMSQFQPDVARVVIDLTGAAPYQVSRDGQAVVISFVTPASAPASVSQNATLTASLNDQTSRPASDASAPAPGNPAEHATHAAQIPAPRYALPGELTQPSVPLASFSEKEASARPEGTPQQAAQQAIQQANTAATTLATSAAQTPAPMAMQSAARYTGEPISVNLKDVDLRDFFRLIHEISGLNVVLDPAVKGSLTIVLDEVPWDQALDIVLQNNGLDKQLKGNVLRIATRSTLKSEADSIRELEKAQNDATQAVTVTRVLSYAKATTLTGTLKRFLSPKGDI